MRIYLPLVGFGCTPLVMLLSGCEHLSTTAQNSSTDPTLNNSTTSSTAVVPEGGLSFLASRPSFKARSLEIGAEIGVAGMGINNTDMLGLDNLTSHAFLSGCDLCNHSGSENGTSDVPTLEDIMVWSSDLSIMAGLISVANLWQQITAGEVRTIFAPTDDAFGDVFDDNLWQCLSSSPSSVHRLLQKHMAADLFGFEEDMMADSSTSVPVLCNDTVMVHKDGGRFKVNEARVVGLNIVARDDSVVHKLDDLLMSKHTILSILGCNSSRRMSQTPTNHFDRPTKWVNAYGPSAGGWSTHSTYPRAVADINGDGKADVVGFGYGAIYTHVSSGSSFSQGFTSYQAFTAGRGGWSSQDTYPRLLADINGDGKADVVGFGHSAIYTSLSTGTSFSSGFPSYPAFTVASGWSNYNLYPRALADVNGDGKADVVGFAYGGVYVALSTGTRFVDDGVWYSRTFTVGRGGWSSFNSYPRFVADVNGDGLADIVGFGYSAVYVSLSTGDGFHDAVSSWSTDFVHPGGWSSQSLYPRQMEDLNGDGKADIIGFAYSAVFIALSTGVGFEKMQPVIHSQFTHSSGGWISFNYYPRFAADVDGDGRADVVGFGASGVAVSTSNLVVESRPIAGWQLITSMNGEISTTITKQITTSSGKTASSDLTWAVGAKLSGEVTFGGSIAASKKVGVELSAEVRVSTSETFEQSFSSTQSKTVKSTCPYRGPGRHALWQWVIKDGLTGVTASHDIHLCTYHADAPVSIPECPYNYCNEAINPTCESSKCFPGWRR